MGCLIGAHHPRTSCSWWGRGLSAVQGGPQPFIPTGSLIFSKTKTREGRRGGRSFLGSSTGKFWPRKSQRFLKHP